MKRRLSILVAVVGVGSLGISLSSCNNVACGPGTVQMQQKDGTLKCIPSDVQVAQTPCDTDGGGVVIVGGKCVSAIQCDPGTTMDVNGICVGTGGGTVACTTPSPGNTCVSGTIYDFTTNMKNAEPVHIAVYDPQALLSGGNAIKEAELTDGGQYVLSDFKAPQLGLIVIVTSTATGGTTMTTAATGDQGVSAGIYRVDAYALKKSDSDAWGFDIATAGAQVGKFYSDPAPMPNALVIADDTHPVAGVTMTQNGSNSGVQYFNDTLTKIDGTLTMTGASGTAIVAAPVSGGFPTFTGTGPASMPISWQSLSGGSVPGLVLITRFHAM
ncbi:MAG TPA: hypothetical protein VN947_10490 [Polyangia bacterium]|nr:hypothetical protein [Polyangia bacterium]